MRGLLVLAGMTGLLVTAAQADDKALILQMQRYDQVIGKVEQRQEQLMSDMRTLQRDNLALQRALQASEDKVNTLNDTIQQIDNVNVRNVQTGQRQLADKVTNFYDWGSQKRDCTELGVKHQQIKVMTRGDGGRTARFLCFDGKVVHLGTEIHDPAE